MGLVEGALSLSHTHQELSLSHLEMRNTSGLPLQVRSGDPWLGAEKSSQRTGDGASIRLRRGEELGQGLNATGSHCSYPALSGFLESMFLHLLHPLGRFRESLNGCFLRASSSFACFTGEWVHRAPHVAIPPLHRLLTSRSREAVTELEEQVPCCDSSGDPHLCLIFEQGGYGSEAELPCPMASLSGPPAADGWPHLPGTCPWAPPHPFSQQSSTGTKAKNETISWENILIWNFLSPSTAVILTSFSAMGPNYGLLLQIMFLNA